MSDDEGKSRGLTGEHQHHHHHHHQQQPPQQYGTFQGGPGYSQPAIGFPRPVPPPGASAYPPPPPQHYPGPTYYSHGYQAIPVAEGTPVRMARLPCCGIGIGWFLLFLQRSLSFWGLQKELMLGDSMHRKLKSMGSRCRCIYYYAW
ncbi:hypothetical protein IHE45_20G086100 [Dioscorea alata]|uniref:Uncharacterized protein n=1 Tax=Dioscorea alata TaxID=55571 RepID=A0ACB7TS84_DIOAL|nr:hypothetical protein IHE45_20G086100 [Dioscorea alata]